MTRPDGTSPCYDDARFTTTRPADVRAALDICGTCTARICRPVLAAIVRDVTARGQLEGVWDGRYYSQETNRRHAREWSQTAKESSRAS